MDKGAAIAEGWRAIAHDVRLAPPLGTMQCQPWGNGNCSLNFRCPLAHGDDDEDRKWTGTTTMGKKVPHCSSFAAGRCAAADQCHMRHDLRHANHDPQVARTPQLLIAGLPRGILSDDVMQTIEQKTGTECVELHIFHTNPRKGKLTLRCIEDAQAIIESHQQDNIKVLGPDGDHHTLMVNSFYSWKRF